MWQCSLDSKESVSILNPSFTDANIERHQQHFWKILMKKNGFKRVKIRYLKMKIALSQKRCVKQTTLIILSNNLYRYSSYGLIMFEGVLLT